MSRKQIEERLQAQLASLTDRITRLESHVQHRSEPLPQDFAEQAVELENAGTMVALLREFSAEATLIDAALRRLAAGTYGECIDCGEPIGELRLEALPAADRCAPCASKSANEG